MDEKATWLMDIVGETAIVDNPEMGESYSLDHLLIPPLKPRLMVRPENVDQVQEIVLRANETRTPLIPISSGGPHFRGDTLPTAPEAIIVDLSGMKRIPKINRRNRLATLEPGVTFSEFLPALQAEGLRMAMPLLPRANKSVIASLLEREPVMSPRYQWNLLEPLRSLQLVWGNGEKFWTGSGNCDSERDEDWDKGFVPVQGPGPGQLDFYKFVSAAQGSMGIVTWASVKCEVYPEVRKLFLVPADRLDDLIDFTYRLLRFRFGDELFILNNTCLACILASDPDQIKALKAVLPAWTVVIGISGGQILSRERVEAQENDIRDIARQFGLQMLPAVSGCRGGELLDLILQPSPEPYWKLRYRGGSQDIFFLTTLDKTPAFVTTMHAVASDRPYSPADIGVYLQPVHQGVGCHCEFMLPFDPENQGEVEKTRLLFRAASHRLFEQGAYFSRPYGIWAEMVYRSNAMNTTVTRKMKDIFDPNNVMNPGKLCFYQY